MLPELLGSDPKLPDPNVAGESLLPLVAEEAAARARRELRATPQAVSLEQRKAF